MIVKCENCQTSFEVDSSLIKEEGSRVKCSRCEEIFTIHREETESPMLEPASELSDAGAEESFGEEVDVFDLEDTGLEDLIPSEEQTLTVEDVSLEDDDVLGDDFDLGDLEDDTLASGEEDIQKETAENQEQDLLSTLEDDLDLGDLNLDEDGELDLLSEEAEESGIGMAVDGEAGNSVGEDTVSIEDEISGMDKSLHIPGEDLEESDISSASIEKPKKTNRPFLWILVVIFGLLAAYAGLWYANPDMIPSLGGSEKTSTEPDALGNRHIILDPAFTKQTWKQNGELGQILVITGLAKNSYPLPRSHIKLRAFLSDNDKKALVRKTVYGGNLLTEEELQTLGRTEISKRLMRRDGEDGTNVNIAPSKSVVFMFVFDQIPANLEGYTIEVVGSSVAGPGK